jgi:hypothetical protein
MGNQWSRERTPTSMAIVEILLQDYDVEISNTSCTLERVPEDKQ